MYSPTVLISKPQGTFNLTPEQFPEVRFTSLEGSRPNCQFSTTGFTSLFSRSAFSSVWLVYERVSRPRTDKVKTPRQLFHKGKRELNPPEALRYQKDLPDQHRLGKLPRLISLGYLLSGMNCHEQRLPRLQDHRANNANICTAYFRLTVIMMRNRKQLGKDTGPRRRICFCFFPEYYQIFWMLRIMKSSYFFFPFCFFG